MAVAGTVPCVVFSSGKLLEMDHKITVNISKDPIQEVQDRYGTPGRLTFFRGKGGLEMVLLQTADGACAEVSFFGAQVLSWQPPSCTRSLLFVSKEAIFDRRRAIRGGIPVCWPQFSTYGALAQQHGYARNMSWELVHADGDHPEGPLVVFQLPTVTPAALAKMMGSSYANAIDGAASASASASAADVHGAGTAGAPSSSHQRDTGDAHHTESTAMSSKPMQTPSRLQTPIMTEQTTNGTDAIPAVEDNSGAQPRSARGAEGAVAPPPDTSAAARYAPASSAVPEGATETILPANAVPRSTSTIFETELQHAQVLMMVQLGAALGDLRLRMSVSNRAPNESETLEFTTALHSYLRVNSLTQVRVLGLSGCEYVDRMRPQGMMIDSEPVLMFRDHEVDRIYRRQPGSSNAIRIEHVNAQKGTVVVEASTDDFPEVVVWNPGPQKSHDLVDLDDREWMFMLCIEPAVVLEPVRLAQNERWCGHVRFTYLAGSSDIASAAKASGT